MPLLRLLFLFAFGCASAFAQAQMPRPPFSNLRAVPSTATDGAPVAARMLYWFCYGHGETIQSSSFQLIGNIVTLTVRMGPFPPNEACFATPPPPSDLDFALTGFAEGAYSLVVQTTSSLPNVTYPTLTTTFLVGPAPSPIPAISLSAGLTLLLALGFGAYGALRARRYAGTP